MTALLVVLLLALLVAWGLAVEHDARTRRQQDPIGDILGAGLTAPKTLGLFEDLQPPPPARPRKSSSNGVAVRPHPQGEHALSYLSVTKFARPAVYATPADLARLRGYARAAPIGGPGVDLLIEEISRMDVASETPDVGFVRLGAPVRYKDLGTKRERQVEVVAPHAADGDDNRVSVLSPIGAALIGLRVGSTFRWHGADGAPRAVKVVDVGR